MTKKKVTKKAPAPVGRPSSYKPQYCKDIIEMMKDGSSVLKFSTSIGVARDTVHEWTRQHKDFSDAFKIAKDLCELWWESQGKNGLWEDKDGPKIREGIYKWNTAARFGWSEKQHIEMDATVRASPLKEELKQKTTEELLDIIKATKLKE